MNNQKETYLKYYREKGKIETDKTVIEKPKTAGKLEKIPKTKKQAKPLKQRMDERTEEKVTRLKKFEKLEPQKIKQMKEAFESFVREGKPNLHIMNELGFKHKNDFRFWIEDQYKKQGQYTTLKDIRQSITSKSGTPTEKWQGSLGFPLTFAERVEKGWCPIVSSAERSVYSRKYPLVAEGKTFCDEIGVIPDISLQPIKRLRIAVHSYMVAVNPKDPSKWNDGSIIKELSVHIAQTDDDKFKTFEGGIIISEELSKTESLNKGDKLLGLNGLKGIICEVRKMDSDLLINKEQIWAGKSSKKCGGAVLELQTKGTLSCFYQNVHTIREKIFKDSTGREYARATFSEKARFSPDLVPFLYHYLGFKTLRQLTETNRNRVKDYLRFLNATFRIENEHIVFTPLYTYPEHHRGGRLTKFDGYFYCRRTWAEPLSKTAIIIADEPCYPHLLGGNLWLPYWFDNEGLLEYYDKDEIRHKTALAKFIEGEILSRGGVTSIPIIKQLYRTIYSEIENSISYLIAVPVATDPKTLILNETDCNEANITEGEKVLAWRPPVVSARLPDSKYDEKTKHSNILKLTVKFGARQKTAEINTATMRLMFGDFDGDALYVMKIPEDAGNALIPGIELDKEVILVKEEIKALDLLKLPTTRRDLLIGMRTAFLTEEEKKGYITKPEMVKAIDSLNTTPENKLRDESILLREAYIDHTEGSIESKKISTIGSLTKWGWMSATQKDIPDLIKATQSIEIMKDRPKAKSDEYMEDKKYLTSLKQRLTKTELSQGYNVFIRFTSRSAYAQGIEPRRKAPTYGLLANKALTPSGSVIGKWLLLLSQEND